MRFRPLAAVVVLAMCAVGCADSANEATTTTVDPGPGFAPFADYEPTWTEGECPIPVPTEATITCGTLVVPEDRTKPDGNQVELPVVWIHYTGANREPDPVVYLHGGPGSSTLSNGVNTRTGFVVQLRRDLILFDQRGSGLGTPRLNCPEREEALVNALSTNYGWQAEYSMFRTSLQECHDRLSGDGIDLSQYNTYNNAADLADLRTALGFEEWNLWGVSYGTRLALAEMRYFPTGVRSAVLDSVYPLNSGDISSFVRSGSNAFDRLANACGTEPACNDRYGDLGAQLDQAVASMNAEPYAFDLTFPDGTTRALHLDGGDTIAGLFNAMYDSTLIPALPAAIADLAKGGRSLVPMIAEMGIPWINAADEGAFMSFECADNGARIDEVEAQALIADPGQATTLLLAGWQIFCDAWPVSPLPASFGSAVTSDIPALVVAGEFDPVTPMENSKAAAEALGNATFYMVPRAGHAPGRESGCSTGLMIGFLDEPGPIDTSCVSTIPAPAFR